MTKIQSLYISSVSKSHSVYIQLMTSQSIGQCTQQFLCMQTKLSSNSLVIDYINGDIHDVRTNWVKSAIQGDSFSSIARPPREPPAILSITPELGWAPLSCGMVGCCQINSILANIGLKNSDFKSVPILMKYINMSLVYLFDKIFIILQNYGCPN